MAAYIYITHSPTPFWGTPKLHKEGKNVARVRAKTPRLTVTRTPHFRNPISAPVIYIYIYI